MQKEMLLEEVAARCKCTRSTARKWLRQRGITGHSLPGEDPRRHFFTVDDSFFEKRFSPVDELRAQGYVTAEDLGARNRCSPTGVTVKLREAGIGPDVVDRGGKFLWKDRPGLDDIVKLRKRKVRENDSVAGEDLDAQPVRGYTRVVKGFGLDQLKEERQKRNWIGRMGRLVVEGHVVAEGIIESVSMCGVFLEGSLIRGNLNELELC